MILDAFLRLHKSPSRLNLEVEFQRSLHDARRIGRVGAGDLSERAAGKGVVRLAEGDAVEGVVHFPTELQTVAFGKPDVLAKTQVPGIDARRVDSRVSANTS